MARADASGAVKDPPAGGPPPPPPEGGPPPAPPPPPPHSGPFAPHSGAIKAPPLRATSPKLPRRVTAAALYWLGLLPGSPAFYVTAPGATFHRFTQQLVDSGDPENPKHRNQSIGGLVALLPEQVEAIQAWVGQRVWRFRGETNDQAVYLSVDDPEYGAANLRDLPLGRFLFMVKSPRFGDPREPLPEPMA